MKGEQVKTPTTPKLEEGRLVSACRETPNVSPGAEGGTGGAVFSEAPYRDLLSLAGGVSWKDSMDDDDDGDDEVFEDCPPVFGVQTQAVTRLAVRSALTGSRTCSSHFSSSSSLDPWKELGEDSCRDLSPGDAGHPLWTCGDSGQTLWTFDDGIYRRFNPSGKSSRSVSDAGSLPPGCGTPGTGVGYAADLPSVTNRSSSGACVGDAVFPPSLPSEYLVDRYSGRGHQMDTPGYSVVGQLDINRQKADAVSAADRMGASSQSVAYRYPTGDSLDTALKPGMAFGHVNKKYFDLRMMRPREPSLGDIEEPSVSSSCFPSTCRPPASLPPALTQGAISDPADYPQVEPDSTNMTISEMTALLLLDHSDPRNTTYAGTSLEGVLSESTDSGHGRPVQPSVDSWLQTNVNTLSSSTHRTGSSGYGTGCSKLSSTGPVTPRSGSESRSGSRSGGVYREELDLELVRLEILVECLQQMEDRLTLSPLMPHDDSREEDHLTAAEEVSPYATGLCAPPPPPHPTKRALQRGERHSTSPHGKREGSKGSPTPSTHRHDGSSTAQSHQHVSRQQLRRHHPQAARPGEEPRLEASSEREGGVVIITDDLSESPAHRHYCVPSVSGCCPHSSHPKPNPASSTRIPEDYPIRGTISPLTCQVGRDGGGGGGEGEESLSFVFGRPANPGGGTAMVGRCLSPPLLISDIKNCRSSSSSGGNNKRRSSSPRDSLPVRRTASCGGGGGIVEREVVCSSPLVPQWWVEEGGGGEGGGGGGVCCEQCHVCLVDLKRQALRLMFPTEGGATDTCLAQTVDLEGLEDRLSVAPALSALYRPGRCGTCGTLLSQLKGEAVAMVRSLQVAQYAACPLPSSCLPTLVGSATPHYRQGRKGQSYCPSEGQCSVPLAVQAQVYLDNNVHTWISPTPHRAFSPAPVTPQGSTNHNSKTTTTTSTTTAATSEPSARPPYPHHLPSGSTTTQGNHHHHHHHHHSRPSPLPANPTPFGGATGGECRRESAGNSVAQSPSSPCWVEGGSRQASSSRGHSPSTPSSSSCASSPQMPHPNSAAVSFFHR
ncbi:hypothetical protein ACOMHN_050994 [Nucella lapillus]